MDKSKFAGVDEDRLPADKPLKVVMLDQPIEPLFDENGVHCRGYVRGPVLELKGENISERWTVSSYYWPVYGEVLPPHVNLVLDTGSFHMSMNLDPVWDRLMAQALNEAADTVDLVKAELKKQAEAKACSSK